MTEKIMVGDACSHSTSVIKAFTWRIIATTITTALVLIFTGQIHLALEVGAADIVTKLLAYYLHERGWLKYGNRLEFLSVLYCKIEDKIRRK